MKHEDLEKYKKQISEAFDEGKDDRDAANEDLRFCNVDGGMWENWLSNTHGSVTNRAKLEFDITTDFVNRYVGEQKLNRANVFFTPDDTQTTDEDADLLTGIYRADFKDHDGQIAQDNAIEEVAETGVGHFKLLTRFEDENDPENDNQNIYWEPIYNSFNTVVWDTQAKRIDKKDAKWCAVLTSYTKEAFNDAFPGKQELSAYQPYTRNSLDWIGYEQIFVAEMYRVEIKPVVMDVYQHVRLQQIRAYEQKEAQKIKDELLEEGWEYLRTRKLKKRQIIKHIFSAVEELEPDQVLSGEYIPIIPLYGFRKYVDGKERYRGLVRKLKDANRMFNTSISRIADAAATSPDEKPIFTKKQVQGYQDDWADMTQGAFKVVNDIEDAQGNPILAGPVGYVKPPAIDPNTVASLEITNNFVQRATGNAPQDTIDPDASGKAINALRARENLNTQVMTDNILVGIKHSGKVYLSIANEIYAGMRTKRTLAVDGAESIQQIGYEVIDNESGDIVLANNITDKRFKVDAEVGPQYESQREATVQTLERAMELVGPESKYFEPLMAMWLKNISGTGLEEVKEFNRNEMLKMGLAKPENEEEEKMLKMLAQQTDPQAEVNKAIAEQQKAEAQNLMAGAEQKVADAEKKRADTQKTKAETVEILEAIGKTENRLKYDPKTGTLN